MLRLPKAFNPPPAVAQCWREVGYKQPSTPLHFLWLLKKKGGGREILEIPSPPPSLQLNLSCLSRGSTKSFTFCGLGGEVGEAI